jgi:hypothetical protein
MRSLIWRTPGDSEEITYLDSSFLGLQFSLHGTKHPSFPSEWRIFGRVDQVADTRPLDFPKHFGSLIPYFHREESSQRLRHSLDVLQTLIGPCHY